MTADRARGALAVLQDADGKFLCEVPCGYIVEPTASAYHIRRERVRAQRRRRAMLRRRVALTVALLTVAALLAALMPWSGSGAADKPKGTTTGTLEEVHQPTAVLLPSSGTVAEYVPNAAEVEALAKLIYGEAGIVPSTTARRLKSIGIAPTEQETLVRSCTALASGSPAIWDTRRLLPTRWRVKTALPFARQTSHSRDRRAGSLGRGHAAAITTYRRKK